MAQVDSGADATPAAGLDQWLAQLRPQLHRYCARMTGSAIDGEDAVQDTLLKAVETFPGFAALEHPRAWLFRVAHNAALDLLRARARHIETTEENAMENLADPAAPPEDRIAAHAALAAFMRVSPAQRSSVVLMDVLGYSMQEVCEITGRSLPAVKADLHRGRARLRRIGTEDSARVAPALNHAEQILLANYVDRFNARDFDAVREMLADEVRLELVAHTRMHGKAQVGNYLHNYARAQDWSLVAGCVEGRPAAVVRAPDHAAAAASAGTALYFVLLEWRAGALVGIRDFRYARYVIDGADVSILGPSSR